MADLFQPQRERVGQRIRTARLGAGLSHDRLAAQVGTSRQHLIKLEKGAHMPRPEMLTKIAEATAKPESFFIDEAQREQQEARDTDDEGRELVPFLVSAEHLRRFIREEIRSGA